MVSWVPNRSSQQANYLWYLEYQQTNYLWYHEYQIDPANKQITCDIMSTKLILPTNKLSVVSWVPNRYCQQANYLWYLEYQQTNYLWYHEYQIDPANKQITCDIMSTKFILPTNKLSVVSWVPNRYCQQANYLWYLEYQIDAANKQITCGILSTK